MSAASEPTNTENARVSMTAPRREKPFILFEDFLKEADFPQNLANLLRPLGPKIGLPARVDELGLVCADVEATADYLTKTYEGMGPFFLGEGSPARLSEDGEPRQYKTRVGFGYYKDLLIELAEPGTGSTVFAGAFDPDHTTIHHLGFFARGDNLHRKGPDGDQYFADRLLGAGYVPHIRALVSAFGFLGRVTIFDTASVTEGVDTEFLDFRLLWERGIPIPLPPWVLRLGAELELRTGHRIFKLP